MVRISFETGDNSKNNFSVAEKLYKEILDKQSDHYESVFYLGTLSMQENKFDNAKSWYEKAINQVAKILKISNLDGGYRTLSNISVNGGQEVPHLHFHLFGGEKIGKMVSN